MKTRNHKIYNYAPKRWHEQRVYVPVWFIALCVAGGICLYAYGYAHHQNDYRLEDFHG